jgi:hypothetical protein
VRAFSELQTELRFAAHERTAMEVCVIKLCHPEVYDRLDTVFARLEKLERGLTYTPAPAAVLEPVAIPTEPLPPPKEMFADWKMVCGKFGGLLKPFLERCRAQRKVKTAR